MIVVADCDAHLETAHPEVIGAKDKDGEPTWHLYGVDLIGGQTKRDFSRAVK
jgi:hypothetical protein